jgi:hypothetical protein
VELNMFNVVLVGENFPINAVDVGSFSFDHRPLKETARVPGILLQAELPPRVRLQILPNRLEAGITQPTDIESQAEELVVLASGIFDYVGPRAMTAVGHNAQYTFPESAGAKLSVMNSLINIAECEEVIGAKPVNIDLQLFFTMEDAALGRVAFGTNDADALVLDFNANYEVSASRPANAATSQLRRSLERFRQIAEQASPLVSRGIKF